MAIGDRRCVGLFSVTFVLGLRGSGPLFERRVSEFGGSRVTGIGFMVFLVFRNRKTPKPLNP